jgi:hypothetical protein
MTNLFGRSRSLLISIVLAGMTLPACGQWTGADPTWAFNPKPDDFRADALLDLRYLNEKVAGESGYVKVDANGDFILGNGKPARFWCVNSGVGRDKPFTAKPLGRKTEPDLARHARFLAKRGVNMNRLHAHVNPEPGKPMASITESERDWIWRSVAAMKKEGIYSTLSPYWAIQAKIGKDWGIPSHGADQNAFGLLFFEPKLQKAYFGWLKALMAEKNPYTGVPLAQDPAVAIFQIQNEDSLLFWTIGNLKGEPKQILGKQFGTWLTKKYGSLAKAKTAWANEGSADDNFSTGMVDFLPLWEMKEKREGGRKQRLDDQLQFWTETMYNFNRATADYLRNELGYKGLINAGNWRTADTTLLNDAERWSYTANDVDAVNRYYGGVHKGPNEGWAIVNGDKFTSPSVLLDPYQLPTNLKQTKGRPIIITESAWVFPQGYASEGPFLIAAYQSLTGVDGFYWFATGDDEWSEPTSANGYMPSQSKWMFANPDMLGTFPAAALMYRQGYLRKGSPVVTEERSLKDIWQRRRPIIAEESGFDPNRDMGDVAPASAVKTAVNPLAFLVGPVETVLGGDPAKTKALSLTPYVDMSAKTVKSITGEVTLDNEKGFCAIDAPSAQGVSAFFNRKSLHRLTDVTISSQNEYGTVLVVAMDGQPIKSSKKVLVQVGTKTRPTNWKEKPVQVALDGGKTVPGFEVVDYGKAPWQVVKPNLTVIVKNAGLKKATALDANGNAVKAVPAEKTSAGFRLKFPEDTLYVVLE